MKRCYPSPLMGYSTIIYLVKRAYLLPLAAATLVGGCDLKPAKDDEYLVVSATHYKKKYPAFSDEQEEIMFKLKHGEVTVVAHCQLWDVKNFCGRLEVGHRYQMKRDRGGLDTLSVEDSGIVLAIEKETLEH